VSVYTAKQLVGGEGRMTNEQIIYLGPEEELTSVRERLENTQAGRVMLVIPTQPCGVATSSLSYARTGQGCSSHQF
jgi:hypothetical protein